MNSLHSEDLIPYTVHKPMALVTPISQVHASIVLLLLTVGNYNAHGWDGLLRQNIHATFHEHWPSGSKI
jgi:hypothetical protein